MAESGEHGANRTGESLLRGIYAGLGAGAVFAVAEMIGAALMGLGWAAPWRVFASIVGGPAALATWNLGLAFLVGLLVHAAVSAFYGAIYGVWLAPRLGMDATWQGIAGATYGLVVWLVNFFLLGALFWPWLTQLNQLVQFVMHVFFYGLPLGLALAAIWARAPVRRARAV